MVVRATHGQPYFIQKLQKLTEYSLSSSRFINIAAMLALALKAWLICLFDRDVAQTRDHFKLVFICSPGTEAVYTMS